MSPSQMRSILTISLKLQPHSLSATLYPNDFQNVIFQDQQHRHHIETYNDDEFYNSTPNLLNQKLGVESVICCKTPSKRDSDDLSQFPVCLQRTYFTISCTIYTFYYLYIALYIHFYIAVSLHLHPPLEYSSKRARLFIYSEACLPSTKKYTMGLIIC